MNQNVATSQSMSLSKKISWMLVSLFVVMGVALAFIVRFATVQYNLEITQRLNGSIAMYVAAEEQLIKNGVHNEDAIKRLAARAMVINPTVEVYLLDKQGHILSHNIPPEDLKQNDIPLQGVRDFLQPESARPLLSLDPRNPSSSKAFSAAEVRFNDQLEGYVYAILGGKTYELLVKDISQNYILQITLASILALLMLSFIVGWLMVRTLTQPLKKLTYEVVNFQNQIIGKEAGKEGGNKEKKNKKQNKSKGDEIVVLSQSFAEMKNKIELQMNQIKAADQSRRDLISNVSHDLRTPLASIQGYLDTLLIKQQSLSESEKLQFMETASKHCKRLNQLVSDLFELSKLDSLAIKPEFEIFSIAELMQDVSMEFKHLCEEKGISLSVEVPKINAMVSADIGLMQRVLENLISNAVKHTESGGQVQLKLDSHHQGFHVMVRDTGCGISEHELPYIFERLYRAENSATSVQNSSGLGLAIVKKIIDLHRTKIDVVSHLGKGTMFSFNLPFAT